jgi:hypothetical protein
MQIGFDLTHSKVGARKNRYESFKMKTRLFDFITDPKIEILAYVDCDILFAIEGCPTEFVQTGPSWNDYQIRLTKVTRNIDDSLNGIHCGTMVIHREHSRDLLNIWKMELDKKSSEGMLMMLMMVVVMVVMMMMMIIMVIVMMMMMMMMMMMFIVSKMMVTMIAVMC